MSITKVFLFTSILSLGLVFQGCEKEEKLGTKSNFGKSVETNEKSLTYPDWYEALVYEDITGTTVSTDLINGTLAITTQDSLSLVSAGISFDQISKTPITIKYSNNIGESYIAAYSLLNAGTVVGSINKIVNEDESLMVTLYSISNLATETLYNSSLEALISYNNNTGQSQFPTPEGEMSAYEKCVYSHYSQMMGIIYGDSGLSFWCDLTACEGAVAVASAIHCATAHMVAGPVDM